MVGPGGDSAHIKVTFALGSPPYPKRFFFAGCPVPIFSYFLSLLLFCPIFKLKPPIFPIFLAGEAKICNKIENGIIVVCVLSEIYHKASSMLTLMF